MAGETRFARTVYCECIFAVFASGDFPLRFVANCALVGAYRSVEYRSFVEDLRMASLRCATLFVRRVCNARELEQREEKETTYYHFH